MGADDYSTSINYGAAYQDPNKPRPVTLSRPSSPRHAGPSKKRAGRSGPRSATRRSTRKRRPIAWVNAHPKDPRSPQVLGFAFRAMRNGCNLEKAYSLRRDVFALLHKNYPNSTWAKTYAQFDAPD